MGASDICFKSLICDLGDSLTPLPDLERGNVTLEKPPYLLCGLWIQSSCEPETFKNVGGVRDGSVGGRILRYFTAQEHMTRLS